MLVVRRLCCPTVQEEWNTQVGGDCCVACDLLQFAQLVAVHLTSKDAEVY